MTEELTQPIGPDAYRFGHDRAPFYNETARARLAQQAWAQVPVRERVRMLRKFRHLLAASADRFCNTIADHVAKPIDECLLSEVLLLAEECRFLEVHANSILCPSWRSRRLRHILLWGQRDLVCRSPRGVVAVIGTWNLPLMISGMQILHALAAGNAVLFKPSELAPRTGELLAELISKAGFPYGLFSDASRQARGWAPTRRRRHRSRCTDRQHGHRSISLKYIRAAPNYVHTRIIGM